jgi:hypothetical protein
MGSVLALVSAARLSARSDSISRFDSKNRPTDHERAPTDPENTWDELENLAVEPDI